MTPLVLELLFQTPFKGGYKSLVSRPRAEINEFFSSNTGNTLDLPGVGVSEALGFLSVVVVVAALCSSEGMKCFFLLDRNDCDKGTVDGERRCLHFIISPLQYDVRFHEWDIGTLEKLRQQVGFQRP